MQEVCSAGVFLQKKVYLYHCEVLRHRDMIILIARTNTYLLSYSFS